MKERIYRVEKVQIQYLKSNPPKLAVVASGMAISSGWTEIELRLISNEANEGIFEFEFVGLPPKDVSMPVLSPVDATYVFEEIPQIFDGAFVIAATNTMLVRNNTESNKTESLSDSIPMPAPELLKGVSLKDNELTLRVPSNGCTSKEDFIVDIQKGPSGLPPYGLRVYRIRPDLCKAHVPHGVEIKYSFEELGLEPSDRISVLNLIK